MTDFSALTTPGRSFSLSGPGERVPVPAMPVRGDLAHIAMAGRVFVPHYAVPDAHVATCDTPIRAKSDPSSDILGNLAKGSVFEVLDVAGGFAWGAVESDGPVGYVAIADLSRRT